MSLRDAIKIPAREITDESVYRQRRTLLQAFAMAPAMTLAGCAEAEPPAAPKATVTPAQARSGFRTSEELTKFADITSYNNFYEFGTGKTDPSNAAKTLKTRPWSIAVGGECAKPGRISLDDLV
ncbi:MAG: mononuclear molybdenum enzyme YedY, partial [Pseudoxanthomonas sp.]